jgi:thioesterase domain-containing protein/acyl carrier protein
VILDQNGHKQRPNEIGEIAVCSKYMARYREKTDEVSKFSTLPDGSRRQYRTGDLGFLDDDNCLHHLGRMDNQVKISGHRIELADVESALLDLGWVREAAVIKKEVNSGAQLIAYLVATSKNAVPEKFIRNEMLNRLPDYMVPSRFIFLDILPVTPNGKIDRSSLPEPDRENLRLDLPFMAPSTATELRLAIIWARELCLSAVGRDDDFKDLGGDSIKAFSIISQISKEFGRDLPPSILLERPNIRKLAAFLDKRHVINSNKTNRLVAIKPNGNKRPFFCVHPHGGQVLAFHKLASEMSSERPFYALEARGLDGMQPPHNNIREMALCYLEEVIKLQPRGPFFLGGRCVGGLIAYEMGLQLLKQGREVGLLVILDTRSIPPKIMSIKHKFIKISHQFIQTIKRTYSVSEKHEKRRNPLPTVAKAHRLARKLYEAPPYPGPVALVFNGFDAHKLKRVKNSWQKKLIKEPHILVLKGATHRTLLDKPYAGKIARYLDQLLDAADSNWIGHPDR